MNIEVTRSDSGAVDVVVGSELNIYGAQEFKDTMLEVMGGGAVSMRLDLSGISEMDTSGFQLLLTLARKCEADGVGLEIVHGPATLSVIDLFHARGMFGLGDRK